MYKKIILLTAFFCTLTQYASEQQKDHYGMLRSWLEVKPSYFFFAASPMNEIYDHGGFQMQTSASIPLHDYFDVYASIGYRQVTGYGLETDEKTCLTVIPVDIGFQPTFKFHDHFYYSIACGPRFFYLSQSNNSFYVERMIYGGGLGFFVNTALHIQFADSILLGVFGEYSYEKKTIDATTPTVYSNGAVQIGGFAFGISLGYAF